MIEVFEVPEGMKKEIRVSAERATEEAIDGFMSWFEVHYKVMNEALDKIANSEKDCWEYALAVLREAPAGQATILRLAEKLGYPWKDSLDKLLSMSTKKFEEELVKAADLQMRRAKGGES